MADTQDAIRPDDARPAGAGRRRLLAFAAAVAAGAMSPALAQQPPAAPRRRQPEPDAAPAQLSAQDRADVERVERHLEGIVSAQARFVQTNPNGSLSQGTLYLRRPGRMRFVYDAPSKLQIVADGSQVTMWDVATNDFGQWPIGWTAASFLVAPTIKLSGDIRVLAVERGPGELRVGLAQAQRPQEGRIEVAFADSSGALRLRGWTIWDSKGTRVSVDLVELRTGVQLPDSLFKFDGPDPGLNRPRE